MNSFLNGFPMRDLGALLLQPNLVWGQIGFFFYFFILSKEKASIIKPKKGWKKGQPAGNDNPPLSITSRISDSLQAPKETKEL